MFRFLPFLITFFSIQIINIYSQEIPIKWGEIPIADLQMTSFPVDSNASAVILCDFGESKLNDELGIEYNRYLRVKILNENGYDWGTHSINLYTGKYGENLDELEAITYSLDNNGEIIENELDDDNIFEEEITEDRLKYTFTMPALKPGCIVDIHYRISAESLWFIRGWVFQKDEPVLWSEYRLTYPKNISFATVSSGFEPWAINENAEVSQVFKGLATTYVGNVAACNYYRWAVKNIPALRDEPYITSTDDYVNKIDVQLAGYAFLEGGVKHILNDWNTLVNDLLDNNNFGKKIDDGNVKELTESITNNLNSPEEKLNAIYNWIIKSIVWTGEKSVFADYDVDDVIEYKKGNNADITFLLISMLKSAGIKANPVILSTRTNGAVQDLYPIVSQFNYVLTRVNIGINTFFVDATDPYRTIDILPVSVLNVRGLIVKPDKADWVILSSSKKNIDQTVINVTLNNDGSITADFDEQFGEYKSLSLRKEFSDKKDIDIVKEIYDIESLGFNIDSTSIVRKDSIDKSLRILTEISSPNYSQLGGDLIYFNPNLIHRLNDNPFKSKVRKFPVDYAYPRGQVIITNITIPEGYELKEKYSNKALYVGNSASFKRQMEIRNNVIQISSKMEIKQSLITPDYYQKLKDFYAQVIASQAEMLVLGPKEDNTNMPAANK